MKRSILLFFGLLFITQVIKAQTSSTTDSIAIIALKCLDSSSPYYNPHRAMNLFKLSASKGNSSSMNMVGNMYKLGIGDSVNKSLAKYWYLKAGKAGFADAYYYLGMVHKDSLQFSEAFACFKQAADLNSSVGTYAYGYMLYKGLGCKQNYNLALRAFYKGVEYKRPDCMYFLGLCLKNGYGTSVNKDSSNFWLNKAAARGYRNAINEINTPEPENAELLNGITSIKIKKVKDEVQRHKKMKNKVIMNKKVSPKEIEGDYLGLLVKYDWSGQKVVSSHKLKVNFIESNGTYNGTWIEDDSISTNLNAILTNNGLSFSNMQYQKNDHYSKNKKQKIRFDDMWLQFTKSKDSVFISGKLRLFNMDEKEKERPIGILLARKKGQSNNNRMEIADNESKNTIDENSIKVYPNPSDKNFVLEFFISKACEVGYTITTIDGRPIFSHESSLLQAGNNSLQIQATNIAKGTYFLNVNYCGIIKTIKIVKL